MDTITLILIVLIGVLVLGGIGLVWFILWLEKQYCHRAIIKKPGNRNIQLRFDKFRVMKDKEGNTYFKLKKYGKEYGAIPPSPDECVELNDKGKMVVTWYDVDGSLVPGKDGFESVNQKALITSTKPFTANQRSIYINQFRKSERDKKKSWTDIVLAAIPIVSVIVLIAVILIFLPEVISSKADYDQSRSALEQETLEALIIITNNLDRLVNDRGILTEDSIVPNNMSEVPN